MLVWRVTRKAHAERPMSGEGAALRRPLELYRRSRGLHLTIAFAGRP